MNIDLPSVLQIMAVVLGTGAVPLAIYLFSRRAQLRQLNTTSDASIVTSAATLVVQLQTQIQTLTDRLARLDNDRNTDKTAYAEQLNRAHGENTRLSVIVAQQQTDLDIAGRQIAELRRQPPT